MRSDEEVKQAIERYSDTVKRLCVLHLKNETDAQDIFQTVFVKYALHTGYFESKEHERAWIIRVTINACKDVLKSVFHSRTVSLEIVEQLPDVLSQHHKGHFRFAIFQQMPERYRRVIYLRYYEGYTAPEIATILNKNVNTIYTLLSRGKNILKQELEGYFD